MTTPLRPLLILAGLALAGSAAAQAPALPPPLVPPPAPSAAFLAQQSAFLVQQEQAREQAIQQQNDLMRLEAQVRTEQAIADIQAGRALPPLPPPDTRGPPPYPQIDTSDLPSIPDKLLQQSNQRVLDASGGPPQ